MGCFSFNCKKCDQPVLHSFGWGQAVRLYLLEDGAVIESMDGMYSGFGTVINDHSDQQEWKTKSWLDICALIASDDECNGIAAVHEGCYDTYGAVPSTKSSDAPYQGYIPFMPDCEETDSWHRTK